jgi:hypothetical protein
MEEKEQNSPKPKQEFSEDYLKQVETDDDLPF